MINRTTSNSYCVVQHNVPACQISTWASNVQLHCYHLGVPLCTMFSFAIQHLQSQTTQAKETERALMYLNGKLRACLHREFSLSERALSPEGTATR